ncbi:MAG TPA: 3'-5' exonuclease, partial [Chthoniobacterales bacterium]|nr:3'-5' exonuclease [Chthoniobacterales bacterium]
VRETEPAETDAIQLITAHKAKGSEWDAVIVPFLAREARLAPGGAYPRIIPGERPLIAFDYSDVADVKEDLERVKRQEMERLLYVALTRARHTLVFALDSDFFRGARGQVHSDTQLKWLKADKDEPNAAALAAAPTDPRGCQQTLAHHKQRKPEPIADTLSALQLETGWIDLARQAAGTIIETVSPSQFTPEEEAAAETINTEEWLEIEPELRPARIENPATRYGVWWHDFVEQIPWVSGASDGLALSADSSAQRALWEEKFQSNLTASPDAARSKREWQLLQKHLEASDGLTAHLRKVAVVRQEMPFFWPMKGADGRGRKSLEGIVDLAMFSESGNEIFILDWKTNRIPADKINVLRDLYRPQMAAYWQAISNLTKGRVTVSIYSTAMGELLIYDPAELAAEWDRLAKQL